MRLPDIFCLLVPVGAHATCQGRDLRLNLTPESQAELERAIGKVPFPEENHWIASNRIMVVVPPLASRAAAKACASLGSIALMLRPDTPVDGPDRANGYRFSEFLPLRRQSQKRLWAGSPSIFLRFNFVSSEHP